MYVFFWSDLNQNMHVSENFIKAPKYESSRKIRQVLVALMFADGQTDGHDEAVFAVVFRTRLQIQ
jgi:hypothetical protein